MSEIYLGVNIDHIATLRNARGTQYPDPVQAAFVAEQAGADGITVHLREDRRHITDRDVEILRQTIQTRMNLEMAVTEEMIGIACRIQPHFVCLVPEKRTEVTTEGGLDVAGQLDKVTDAVARLSAVGAQVSLFIDADPLQIDAAAESGAPSSRSTPVVTLMPPRMPSATPSSSASPPVPPTPPARRRSMPATACTTTTSRPSPPSPSSMSSTSATPSSVRRLRRPGQGGQRHASANAGSPSGSELSAGAEPRGTKKRDATASFCQVKLGPDQDFSAPAGLVPAGVSSRVMSSSGASVMRRGHRGWPARWHCCRSVAAP